MVDQNSLQEFGKVDQCQDLTQAFDMITERMHLDPTMVQN